MSATSRKKLRLNLPWRLVVVLVVSTVSLAAMLYSTYAIRPRGTLVESQLSPATFVSPVNVEVIDRLATERARQAARAQINTIYSLDQRAQRLVLDALAVSTLPEEVRELVTEAYRRPEGIWSQDIPALIRRALEVTPPERHREVRRTLDALLIPTAQPNALLTAMAQEAAAREVEPVTEVLQAGQVIVREGETLTADHLRVLELVGLYDPQREITTRLVFSIASSLLMALLLSLPLVYAYYQLKEKLSTAQLYFLVGLSLLGLIGQRLALEIDPSFIFISLITLLVAVLVSESVALAASAVFSIIVALFEPSLALPTLLAVLSATTVSSLLAGRFKMRASLFLAGILGGLAAALALTVYSLLGGNFLLIPSLTSVLWVLAGGVLAGILALGLLPLAETNSIGFLTEFRLLELSNPSQPLLQRLLIEAPGTYQHSVIIANLVDRAVRNIGGNATLARVGALYHDVGKMKRAQFFVENQFADENPHDRISPHLSYLIITSHVRDGIELLREYRLPRALEPFVLEHHGTTVLSYFYKRALEESDKVDELNFRYPGPRPRSKETAVLMLADSIESASRTLSEPSQGSIRALIERMIEQRLQDGQLAESPLNFSDLETIANTFERMLTAILHRRVSYPSDEEIKGLKRGRGPRRDSAVPVS